jgi:DnaJ-class molecular chaperone
MPWMPYAPVLVPKGMKHCDECNGTGMIRVCYGGDISDRDFWRCDKCEGTGLKKLNKKNNVNNKRS